MPDAKITALTSIGTSTDPANDPLVLVDVSDTSMAASGTTKKVTLNQLLATSPSATLASATITGDLTVDSGTLKVDSSNNYVGINKLVPAANLDVFGSARFGGSNYMEFGAVNNLFSSVAATGAQLRTIISSAAAPTYSWTGDSTTGLFNPSASVIGFTLGGSEAMRLNSTGLGVGVSPAVGFDLQQTSPMARITSTSTTGYSTLTLRNTGASGRTYGITVGGSGTGATAAGNLYISDDTASAIRLVLDASGNLLVATTTNTPSARLYVNQASGSNPGIYIAGGASTTPLINFNGAGRFRSDGSYLVMETTNASGTIYVTANTNGVYLSPGGTSWTANSDERLKDIIEPISNAVSKVGSLRSVIGKFKTDSEGTRRTFLIAQDVQKVLPEAVDASNPDRLGVGYSEVIPLLVAAIKELTARVEALEA